MEQEATISPFAPAGPATATRFESGEFRSAVVRRANPRELQYAQPLVDRFAEYETDIEAINVDPRWPEAYKVQLRDAKREALYADAASLEGKALAEHYAALDDAERATLNEIKNSPMPAEVPGMLLSIDRISDPQALIDLAEKQMTLDYGPRLRHVIPAIQSRIAVLTKGTTNETLKATVRALDLTWREWQERHPSAAARRRDIRARRERVDQEVGGAFERVRLLLKMAPR